MYKPEHFLSTQIKLGETPIWSPGENALFWVNWGSGPIYRLDLMTNKLDSFEVDVPVTSIARRHSGGWIVVSQTGIYGWDPDSNVNEKIFGIAMPDKPEIVFNDCAVDRQGRLLIGSADMDDAFAPTSSVYQLDENHELHQLDTGYATTNGIGVSPDGKTIYITDMRNNRIISLDYDSDRKMVGKRQCFASVPEEEGLPDGLIVDSEGFVWSGHWAGWKLTRYDPDGKIDCKIDFPVEHVISFSFAGKDLSDLYVTTAWWGFSDEKREKQPLAGDLFCINTHIKGINEPAYRG